MSEESWPEFPPTLRARFTPVKALGSGAFGAVVLAEDGRLSRPVAIKLMRAERLLGEDFRERFIREARLTASIQSSHVAKVYDHAMEEEHAWIVYEFVEGESLRERLVRQGKLTVDEAGRIFRDVLDGLAAAHARGVVHRDVKPANVMLTGTGSAVLIDLGLGRGPMDVTLTESGAPLGSPAYMAPEQMAGGASSPSWDLYAAALTYLQMLTGEVPMLARTIPETYYRRSQGLQQGLRDRGVRVPRSIDELVTRTLHPDLEKRPGSAEELRGAFDAAWSERSRKVRARPTGTSAMPRLEESRATRPAMILAAGVVLGVLAGAVARRGEAPPPPPAKVEAPESPAGATDWPDRLAELRKRVDRDEAVLRATSLVSGGDPEQALAVWLEGRAAYRRLVREARLGALVVAGARAPVEREVHDHATRLQLIQKLLTYTTRRGIDPLFTSSEDPGLERITERGIRWRGAPFLTGVTSASWRERRRRYRPLLEKGGRRWWAVRRFEELLRPDRPELGPVSGIMMQNLAGRKFKFPLPTEGDIVFDDLYSRKERQRDRIAPKEFRHALTDSPGDLVLGLQLFGWTHTGHLLLEVEGSRGTLPVLFSPPVPMRDGRPDARDSLRQGFFVRVSRRLLPGALRALRGSIHGVQPLSSPKSTLNIEEIHQLIGGPMPEGLGGNLPDGSP